MLAVTGTEALYADMGHFGRNPIRIAWLCCVFPGVVLNYLGQGAFIIAHPAGAANPNAPQIFVPGPDGPITIPQGGPNSSAPGPKIQLTVSANNLLNHTQLRGYSGVMTSPLFGKPTGAASGRMVTIGLGLLF